jgi:hypothetical protein
MIEVGKVNENNKQESQRMCSGYKWHIVLGRLVKGIANGRQQP